VLLLLIFSFWVSYYLKVRRIRSVHETIIAMFSGMCVGALVRIAPGHVVRDMIAFKPTILLNVLLPPIILNSGYQLKQDNFFRNFAVILTFAFAGTFISAVALGVIVYLYSLLGLEGLSLTIIECLLFGSTLSATDPVTILAIFNALHVDPKLYSVIFGESILNDAVAIVMFETLSQFHGEQIYLSSFFHGVGIFLLTFCISMALGVVFGLSCSLMLKHSELGRYTEIEACLVLLIAYTSYFFSNALTMSGIVSLLFCGITLKHYAYHNMSHRTQRTTRYVFGSLASLSENFVFIYLGLSLFTQTQLVYKPMFILVTCLAVCIARYCAVFPISKLINIVFRARGARTDELPHSYQVMLFWAGLRGAVGVALAAGMKGEHAAALRTTVLVAVVMTMVVFGGTIQRMIEVLGIRTGVEEEDDDSEEEDGAYALVDGADLEGRRAKRRSFGGTPASHHYASQHQQPLTALQTQQGVRGAAAYEPESPFRDQSSSRPSSRLGARALSRGTHPRSPELSSSDDSDPDVLPGGGGAVSSTGDAGAGGLGQVWSALDEQYLLPVFSNATASRHHGARKSRVKVPLGAEGGDGEGTGPYGAGGAGRNKSFSDIMSALVAPALSSSSASSSTPALAVPYSSSPSSANPLASPLQSYASPNSPMPSVDLTAAAVSSVDSRPPPRSRSSGQQHTPQGSGSTGSSSGGERAPVMPFAAGGVPRRGSMLAREGSGEKEGAQR
ncbi:monovalent cation:H+ antiporter, CPA1 (nhx1), partial [Rhodotorula kratochvilovae]